MGYRAVEMSRNWVVAQMGCRAIEMSRNWVVAQMGCRATGISRSWNVAQLKWRENKMSPKWMSRRWDVAPEKSRANGISPLLWFKNQKLFVAWFVYMHTTFSNWLSALNLYITLHTEINKQIQYNGLQVSFYCITGVHHSNGGGVRK